MRGGGAPGRDDASDEPGQRGGLTPAQSRTFRGPDSAEIAPESQAVSARMARTRRRDTAPETRPSPRATRSRSQIPNRPARTSRHASAPRHRFWTVTSRGVRRRLLLARLPRSRDLAKDERRSSGARRSRPIGAGPRHRFTTYRGRLATGSSLGARRHRRSGIPRRGPRASAAPPARPRAGRKPLNTRVRGAGSSRHTGNRSSGESTTRIGEPSFFISHTIRPIASNPVPLAPERRRISLIFSMTRMVFCGWRCSFTTGSVLDRSCLLRSVLMKVGEALTMTKPTASARSEFPWVVE